MRNRFKLDFCFDFHSQNIVSPVNTLFEEIKTPPQNNFGGVTFFCIKATIQGHWPRTNSSPPMTKPVVCDGMPHWSLSPRLGREFENSVLFDKLKL